MNPKYTQVHSAQSLVAVGFNLCLMEIMLQGKRETIYLFIYLLLLVERFKCSHWLPKWKCFFHSKKPTETKSKVRKSACVCVISQIFSIDIVYWTWWKWTFIKKLITTTIRNEKQWLWSWGWVIFDSHWHNESSIGRIVSLPAKVL